MRILFVGDEEEYESAIEAREDGAPFSLFFSLDPHADHETMAFDAMLVPALRFLSRPYPFGILVIASGTADIAQECFDAGCHDFIREPFTETELHARVMARTRRRLEFSHGTVVAEPGLLRGPEASVRLGMGHFGILNLLSNNPGRPVPRGAIAAVIGSTADSSRATDMHISRLRGLLRRVGASELADCLQCKDGAYLLSRR